MGGFLLHWYMRAVGVGFLGRMVQFYLRQSAIPHNKARFQH